MDSIVRTIDIAAPVERVWRALTDHEEFGRWFRVKLEGPFTPGELSCGTITHPGYEHVRWTVRTVAIEPQRRFAFSWHPYAIDPNIDYSNEQPTLVEFRLEPNDTGTHLTITESGFDKIPVERRDEALRMNGNGWTVQVENIRTHVEG
ncbi:SRPBCC family protein [Rhizorhabdus argentea]|uniref:SRPBCC family protein n=1 Tax=Rhizorhabdus argentea TaxID=1387174 RepID=UPI0030EEEBF7